MSSNSPRRSSRSKGSSKQMINRETGGSNSSKKKSVSSISVQAPSSRMNSYANHNSGAEEMQVTDRAGYGYGNYDTQQDAKGTSGNDSGNEHYTIEQYEEQFSIRAPNYGNYSSQQYVAQVAAGAISLGIDVSPALQLSLADRHGRLRAREPTYSTVGEGAQFLGDNQSGDFGNTKEIPQYEPYVALDYDNDGLNGDLAGVGSQFDRKARDNSQLPLQV
ncbi:hypothetical protein VF21_06394 [Pseudogymnoascus sp. 05NY08]|nr:hypothetical protein VF21_06394 [Pseudogymnoascus sp. 05NY08]